MTQQDHDLAASRAEARSASRVSESASETAGRIDPNRVVEILGICLSERGDVIEGIVERYQIDRTKLAEYRPEIVGMLSLLPEEFFDNGGGGWSFLNFCTQADGHLWTGLQQTCGRLIGLAMGLGLAEFMMPREMWSMFPGGVPYVQIKRSLFDAKAVQS